MMRRSTQFAVRVVAPPPPEAEIEAATGLRKRLMRWYGAAAGKRAFRNVFLAIGPFFQLIGVRKATAR